MIINNQIIFGNGDIVVSSDKYYIIFSEITSFKKCGTCMVQTYLDENKIEYSSKKIKIKLNMDDCFELKELLDNVKQNKINSFNFKNYVFDFSQYNMASVCACLKYINCIIASTISPIVC